MIIYILTNSREGVTYNRWLIKVLDFKRMIFKENKKLGMYIAY